MNDRDRLHIRSLVEQTERQWMAGYAAGVRWANAASPEQIDQVVDNPPARPTPHTAGRWCAISDAVDVGPDPDPDTLPMSSLLGGDPADLSTVIDGLLPSVADTDAMYQWLADLVEHGPDYEDLIGGLSIMGEEWRNRPR